MTIRHSKYPKQFRDEVCALVMSGRESMPRLAEQHGFKRATGTVWMTRFRKMLQQYDDDEQREIVLARFVQRYDNAHRSIQDSVPAEVIKTPEVQEILPEGLQELTAVMPDVSKTVQDSTNDDNANDALTPALQTITPIEQMVAEGTENIKQTMLELQNNSVATLSRDINLIDILAERVKLLVQYAIKPIDINYLTKSLDQLIKLKRAALLLPYGSVDPNKAIAKPSESKHLHLHNCGAAGFIPK